jgi:sphingomyelin phosphodiesterase acid-like 3
VSDIHFDPFHDPALVRQLVAAPVSRWSSILAAPPSPDQQQAFAALQQKCHAHGIDTPFALLRSSLQAMQSREPGAKFMTVSGDLIAHGFYCRFTTLVPGSTQSEYQDFVVKTLSFVMEELRASFPHIPVYVALGNNDTACDDYRLDPRSAFLAQTGRILAKGLPLPQRQQALEAFDKGGYYSLTMEAPMRGTRLIVVNDLFLSPRYSTCAGRPDPAAATAEMAWLQEQ